MKRLFRRYAFVAAFCFAASMPSAAQTLIAATGDSNIDGKLVDRSEAYPAKLEHWLQSRGYNVKVVNTGISGDTTAGLLARLDSAVPEGTKIAVISIGINDTRKGTGSKHFFDPDQSQANVDMIASKLKGRGITLYMFSRTGAGAIPLGEFFDGVRDLKYRAADGRHLNPAGYDLVVARTAPKIARSLKR